MARRQHQARDTRGRFAPLDDLRKRTAELGRMRLRFGPMGPDGGPAPQHGDTGMTSAELLKIHELGLGGAPERPVIRYVQHAKRRELEEAMKRGLVGMIKHGWSAERAAQEMGEEAVRLMRERIESSIPPPLADSTKDDPGRDPRGIPLLDSGQILHDLGWAVDR